MPLGETAKRRVQRACTFGSVANTASVDTVSPTALTIPSEATHVAIFNESASIFLKFVFETAGAGFPVNWITVGFRQQTIFPIPPTATALTMRMASAGTANINVWFYGVPSPN